MLLRSAFRVGCLVVMAALLCLMLPRALSATEGAFGSKDGAAVGAAQALSIRDIGDSPCKAEIEQAVRLGYMSLGGDSCFKPDARIRGKDFLAAIRRGMAQAGMPDGPDMTLENPNGWISRQGLFLKTWRVAIIEVPSTGIQTAMVPPGENNPK